MVSILVEVGVPQVWRAPVGEEPIRVGRANESEMQASAALLPFSGGADSATVGRTIGNGLSQLYVCH